MTDKRREVEELRQEIGKVDAQLLAALERRAKLSKRVGEARKSLASPISLPERAQIEAIVAGAAGTDLPPEALREIFREIVATCFSLETPVVVAFCGLDGAFAHAAARSRFGVAAEYTACDTVAATLDEVTRQRASYAVVPYETRTDGLMQATIAALTPSDLKIVACFETNVNLQLASKAGSIAEILSICKAHDVACGHPHVEADNVDEVVAQGFKWLMPRPGRSNDVLDKALKLSGR